MTASKALHKIYDLLGNKFGPAEARETVSALMANIIEDLQDAGLPVTERAIEEALIQSAAEYEVAVNSDVA